MRIDESGRHDESVSVDLALAPPDVLTDGHDSIALDGDVTASRRPAGAIDDNAVTNDEFGTHGARTDI
jgi:hypothetical protein